MQRLKAGRVTVTVNEQALPLPAASRAVQVTCVVPFGKSEPEAGTHAIVAPHGSDATTPNVTTRPAGVFATVAMFAGQAIAGGAESTTVTVAVQVAATPSASVTASVTTVSPS